MIAKFRSLFLASTTLLLLFYFNNAHAQTSPLGLFNVRNITPHEYGGLPQVFEVVEDDRGVIYFSNNVGVIKYDGAHFSKIKILNDAAVKSLELVDSILYVGTVNQGACFFNIRSNNDHPSLRVIHSTDTLGLISNIIQIENEIYFQGKESVALYNPTNHSTKLLKFVGEIDKTVNINQQLVVFSDTVPFVLQGEQFVEYKGLKSLKTEKFVGGIRLNYNTNIFYTSKKIFVQNNNVISPLMNCDSLRGLYFSEKINDHEFIITSKKKGAYWFDVRSGLKEIFNENYGMHNQICNVPHLSRNQELILPCEYGLSIINIGSPLTKFDHRNGFHGNVENIYPIRNGVSFVGNKGIHVFHPKVNKLSHDEDLSIPVYDAVEIGQNKEIRAFENGIYLYENFHNTKMGNDSSYYFPWFIHRCKSDTNYIIIGLDEGEGLLFLKLIENKWQIEKVIQNQGTYRYVEEDNDGNIWLGGSENGIGYFKSNFSDLTDTILHYSEEDQSNGLIEGNAKPVFNGKKMYFATFANGLCEFDSINKKFVRTKDFGDKIQQFDRCISTATFDHLGQLWATLSFSETEHEVGYVDQKGNWNSDEFVDITDLPVSMLEVDNTIWIGASNNLYAYSNTSKISDKNYSFDTTFVTKIKSNDSLVTFDYNNFFNPITILEFPHSKKGLNFNVARTYFSSHEDVNFRFILLEGKDTIYFTDWTNDPEFSPGEISQGDYTLLVESKINNGRFCKASPLKFTVFPPWYLTWWMFTIYLLGLIGCVLLIIIWRERSNILQKEKLKKIVKKRTIELEFQKNEAEKLKLDAEGLKLEAEKQRDIVQHQNQEITSSINYASRIQEAVLTSEDYLQKMFSNYFIFYQPKDIVSGDFYWAFETPSGKKIWAAADCTGHGIPGGFMSMMGMSFLNEIIVENNVSSPDIILNQLREKIIKAFEQKDGETTRKDGMDIALCSYDPDTSLFEFSGAYNPLYLIRNKKHISNEFVDLKTIESENHILVEIKADKMPVGKHEIKEKSFTKTSIEVKPGDTLYTFSDGYPDQFGGAKNRKYLSKNFKKFLLSQVQNPFHIQRQKLEDEFEQWKTQCNAEQTDDIIVMGVKLN